MIGNSTDFVRSPFSSSTGQTPTAPNEFTVRVVIPYIRWMRSLIQVKGSAVIQKSERQSRSLQRRERKRQTCGNSWT